MSLRVCDWKHNKRWVYSITYDEALADLDRFAIPHHDELGIPGHVEAVVSQIGEIRNIGTSSFNGYRHMNADEMKDLMARGWGIGNHAWSHKFISNRGMIEQELQISRDVLEEAIGVPVLVYCAPNGNENVTNYVLEFCRQIGYACAMSITDSINTPEDENFYLNRTPVHVEMERPLFSVYDPYRNIRIAQEHKGWIIDYNHCPLEEAVHTMKDCTEAQLRRRLETILMEGGDEVWCATPEEVISYHWCRRLLGYETIIETEEEHRYRLYVGSDLPKRITRKELTLDIDVPTGWCRNPRMWIDGKPQSASLVKPGVLRATIDIGNGIELSIRGNEL